MSSLILAVKSCGMLYVRSMANSVLPHMVVVIFSWVISWPFLMLVFVVMVFPLIFSAIVHSSTGSVGRVSIRMRSVAIVIFPERVFPAVYFLMLAVPCPSLMGMSMFSVVVGMVRVRRGHFPGGAVRVF